MIKYLKQSIIAKKDNKEIRQILEYEDFCPIVNKPIKKIERIFLVIRRILPHSGGYTSILRLGTELAKDGYDVYYAITSEYQSKDEAEKNASINLSNYKGEFVKFSKVNSNDNDILIATYWKTAYQIKHMPGYKMYFVQDYEPYFSQYGEQYLLAQKSYELGLHMVSLGQWNKYMIEKSCSGVHVDYIDFPFEPSEYTLSSREFTSYALKKEFVIAAFVKEDQKRIPNIVMGMLEGVEKEFAKYGYKLNIKYFGLHPKIKPYNGENMGLLNKKQMADLYSRADFGICASMTNISLVPYEMLATGLPLIEFKDGTYPFFFPENTAILTNFSYKYLFEQIYKCINEPENLKNYQRNALLYIEKLSWKRTGEQFIEILKKILV